jgi:ABC-2 type transport system permease protein
VFAVLSVSEEYGTGMIRTSLAAVPRRFVLLGAKATSVGLVVLAASVLAVAACLAVGRLALPGGGLDPAHGYALVSLGAASTVRAAVGSVLYLVLVALLAVGAATVVRDTAVSVGVVLALLYLPALLAEAVGDPLRRHVLQLAPMPAGLAVQATTRGPSVPLGPWAGLGVLAAWAVASLVLAGAVLRTRDA